MKVASDREDGVGEWIGVHGVVHGRVATGLVTELALGLCATPLVVVEWLWWHAAVGVELGRGDHKLTDELLLKDLVPGHHDLCHLTEGRQRVGSHEEVVRQVNLRLRSSLVDHKGAVVAPHVQIGEAKFEEDGPSIGGKSLNRSLKLLLPSELSIETDLGKADKGELFAREQSAPVGSKSIPVASLDLKVELCSQVN